MKDLGSQEPNLKNDLKKNNMCTIVSYNQIFSYKVKNL